MICIGMVDNVEGCVPSSIIHFSAIPRFFLSRVGWRPLVSINEAIANNGTGGKFLRTLHNGRVATSKLVARIKFTL